MTTTSKRFLEEREYEVLRWRQEQRRRTFIGSLVATILIALLFLYGLGVMQVWEPGW